MKTLRSSSSACVAGVLAGLRLFIVFWALLLAIPIVGNLGVAWLVKNNPDKAIAKKFKGARWALLKRPENLTDEQSVTLRRLRNRQGLRRR